MEAEDKENQQSRKSDVHTTDLVGLRNGTKKEAVAVGKIKPHHAREEEVFKVQGLKSTLKVVQTLAEPSKRIRELRDNESTLIYREENEGLFTENSSHDTFTDGQVEQDDRWDNEPGIPI